MKLHPVEKDNNVIFSQNIIRDLEHPRERINAAMSTVTPHLLQNIYREVDYRIDVCLATEEARIETF